MVKEFDLIILEFDFIKRLKVWKAKEREMRSEGLAENNRKQKKVVTK